jgi:hypothetical protein
VCDAGAVLLLKGPERRWQKEILEPPGRGCVLDVFTISGRGTVIVVDIIDGVWRSPLAACVREG